MIEFIKRFFYNLSFVRRKTYDELEHKYIELALDVIHHSRCVMEGKIFHHTIEDQNGVWVYGYCGRRDNDTPIKYIPYSDDKGKAIRTAKSICGQLNGMVHKDETPKE